MAVLLISWAARAAEIDWKKTQEEGITLLQQYVRIDTSNPPGDTRKAADFLSKIVEKEGLTVTRYESAPGQGDHLHPPQGGRTGKAYSLAPPYGCRACGPQPLES